MKTGAYICLMRVDVLFRIGDVNLIKDRVKLCGVGKSELLLLGIELKPQFVSMEIISMYVFI